MNIDKTLFLLALAHAQGTASALNGPLHGNHLMHIEANHKGVLAQMQHAHKKGVAIVRKVSGGHRSVITADHVVTADHVFPGSAITGDHAISTSDDIGYTQTSSSTLSHEDSKKQSEVESLAQVGQGPDPQPDTVVGQGLKWLSDTKDYSHDWLYGYSVTRCTDATWDNNVYSVSSRVFLSVLFLLLVGAIVYVGQLKPESDILESLAVPEEQCRRIDLDWARILCVSAVVGEHCGGWQWSEHNVFFMDQWVIPFLYLTSGTSFMISSKGVIEYVKRLSAVLAVGLSANLVADCMRGQFLADISNTIFQMWYVIMLIVLAFVTKPLQMALSARKIDQTHEAGRWQYVALVGFGMITCVAFVYFLLATSITPSDVHPMLEYGSIKGSAKEKLALVVSNAPVAVIQVVGMLFLCHLACLFRANNILPWLLLAHIYLPRLVIPWQGVGFAHNIELFIFGMVAESWKLAGRQQIAAAVQQYWPVLIVILLFLSCPDMQGRCDLLPAGSIGERLRFYAVEMILGLCLVTGAFKVGDPSNYRAMEWLNWWALYAYCFHVAFARTLRQPFGAVLTYGSCAFFYLRHRWTSAASSNAERPLGSKSECGTGGTAMLF